MDAATLSTFASVATIMALILAGIFAYLKFWRTASRQSGNDMYDKALRIIQSYETEATRKDQEISELRRRLRYMEERLELVESRNTWLVRELAAAYRVPESFVQSRLDGNFQPRKAEPNGNYR